MKNQASHVEIKTVTWSKDSHGLFDYESKNVQYTKTKVESSSKVFKAGNEILIKDAQEPASLRSDSTENEESYLFSVQACAGKNNKYYLKAADVQNLDDNPQNNAFLIVRSLKNDDGTQKGYDLEVGDVIRLGRIEYRVLEMQDHDLQVKSLLTNNAPRAPFSLAVKDCDYDSSTKRQCRICLMDEDDSEELLVNPCNCKGTSEYMHIKCLQDWINTKVKKKINSSATCIYWKKLNCEICKVALPDLVQFKGEKRELVPIYRSESPYILLERVFYDKTKESTNNSKTNILLSISKDTESIKFGRGHECDLRENDISVSRLHAYIKYNDGKFTVIDNNSKFGTLILLRKDYEIERKKIALQTGRTVLTFSLKPSVPSNVPIFKDPLLLKMTKSHSPKTAGSNSSKSPPIPSDSEKSPLQPNGKLLIE